MRKYYYIILGSIGAALLIALAILSYFDRTVLYPVKSTREVTAPESAGGSPERRSIEQRAMADDDDSPSPRRRLPADREPLPAPSLNLRLIGTTVFGEKSTAILEDTINGTRGVYRLGDSIREFILSTIDRDSVTLTAGGRSFVLTRDAGTGQDDSDSFFTKIDDDSWLVSADKAADMISNIDQYAGQVIAFQHRVNGEAAGFKIRHLKENNDFAKLGLKNNDIIKRVNGLEVNDLTDVLKTMYQLSDETSFTVEVEGDSGSRTLNYEMSGDIDTIGPLIDRVGKIISGTGTP